MARNVQLLNLVKSLRAEVGHSIDTAVGADSEFALKEILRRNQEALYDDYDWPFMRIMPSFTLSAGQRYYGLPTDLNMERIEQVELWNGGTPEPLARGIGFKHYASQDSDSDDRSDPARAWDIRWRTTVEQIEIWPIPATNGTSTGGRVQFMGIRDLRALVSDDDVADIDAILIVLFSAAEILSRAKHPDAQAKVNIANARYNRLKGRMKGASEPIIIGGAGPGPVRRGPTVRVNRN